MQATVFVFNCRFPTTTLYQAFRNSYTRIDWTAMVQHHAFAIVMIIYLSNLYSATSR